MFEVLQKGMASEKKTVSEINIQPVQEVATDIGSVLLKYTANIRGKTAKFKNAAEKYGREIDDVLDDIKDAVASYQKKLMAAVSGIED
jgi:hypothetical protein